MKYKNNVKPGDMITTSIGTAVLLKQTRAKWFYLFKKRVNSMSKSDFWRMVDLGMLEIHYSESKKYRRLQKNDRVLDLRSVVDGLLEERLDEFVRFANTPFSLAFMADDMGHPKIVSLLNNIRMRGLNYHSTNRQFSGLIYMKVFENI